MNFEDYKYRIELHSHTAPSTDSAKISPEWLIRRYKELGYDAIVLTNKISYERVQYRGRNRTFDKFVTDFNQAKAIGDEIGIKVLMGMEVTVEESERDFLVYGVDLSTVNTTLDNINGTMENLHSIIAGDNTVILQAHPFRDGETRANLKDIDGIEVFNMRLKKNSRVGTAAKYAYENDVNIIVCGSDAHSEEDHGTVTMLSKTLPEDSFEMARIIRSNDYLFEVEGNIIIPYTYKNND